MLYLIEIIKANWLSYSNGLIALGLAAIALAIKDLADAIKNKTFR